MNLGLAHRPQPKIVLVCNLFACLAALTTAAAAVFGHLLTTASDEIVLHDTYYVVSSFQGLGALVYVFFFIAIGAGLDRLDALVWLNASHEDRVHIYRTRKRRDPPGDPA